MTLPASAPGGLSPTKFKFYVAEAGQWIWGTAQGAFNEKQTLSQIITDAVIGMIPVVGDVTAARDLIAVGSGMATDPAKRERTTEWVLLVILIFALIPVFGGIVKGVGRIALHVTETAAKDGKTIALIAQDVIQFLNRIGHKNAELWLRGLNVLKYESEILSKFRGFCDLFLVAIYRYGLRFRKILPNGLVARMEQLSLGFAAVRKLGDRMIPEALKELHSRLEILQKYIHAGGSPPPSMASVLEVQSGQKTITYAEEARLVESAPGRTVVYAGKFKQNFAGAHPQFASKIRTVYRHEPGYPDLLAYKDPTNKYYPGIAAASGVIKNEKLSGVTLFRGFGGAGVSRGVDVGESFATGAYWGMGKIPANADEWRIFSAVLDEWNRNGWLAMLHIPDHVQLHACTSTVSEQFSKAIANQYLPGGGRQAVVSKISDADTRAIAQKLLESGGGRTTLPNGIVFELRPSGWTGANEVIGYGTTVIPGASVVQRLGISEKQEKIVRLTATGEVKHERNTQ